MSAKIFLVVSACLGMAMVAGGCRAKAAATVRTGPPPPRHVHRPAPAPAWDPAGWELLGETWVEGKSDGYVRFVGTSELLGALGLILPILTGILALLTPAAAIGLALMIYRAHKVIWTLDMKQKAGTVAAENPVTVSR